MALSDRPFGRRPDLTDPNRSDPVNPRPSLGGNMLPILLAAVAAVLLLALFYPDSKGRVGDTNNTGPSVQTVTPQPTPSTSPRVPSPKPGEPRPTQAPIP